MRTAIPGSSILHKLQNQVEICVGRDDREFLGRVIG
jgi:hypothetical protein